MCIGFVQFLKLLLAMNKISLHEVTSSKILNKTEASHPPDFKRKCMNRYRYFAYVKKLFSNYMQTVSILDINGFHDTDNESASDE
jgi:hypothetical protein